MRGSRSALTVLGLAVLGLAAFAATARAQPGVSYPKVYGPTGSLYGPTQAHYQYQRQYGRAWVSPNGGTVRNVQGSVNGGYQYTAPSYVNPPIVVPYGPAYGGYGGGYIGGYGGGYLGNGLHVRAPFVNVDIGRGVSVNVGGYGYGYSNGYQGYGVVGAGPFYHQGWESVAPVVRQAHPLWVGEDPFQNAALARARFEEQQRWQAPLAVEPVVGRPRPLVTKSSEEMVGRSLKHRSNGDSWFRKQRYSTAYDRYRAAITAAGDLPDNHLRAGFALVAMGREALAAKHFKEALELAPELPITGIPLDELFGEENALSRTSVILKTSAWVREDIRDPERLFVLGVMLHFDGQRDKAAEFFETAYRLAGRGDHLLAFLRPQAPPVEVAEPGPGGPPQGNGVPADGPKLEPIPQKPPEPGPALPLPFPEP